VVALGRWNALMILLAAVCLGLAGLTTAEGDPTAGLWWLVGFLVFAAAFFAPVMVRVADRRSRGRERHEPD
jgi:hypothetical protein